MKCRVCDSKDLDFVIDLGNQPWCNNFLKESELGKEPYYPLRVMFCNKCKTSQLDFTVKKEVMFGDHTYLSGVTKSLSSHFKNVANEIDKKFFETQVNKSILDIGSNNGTQLQHFKNIGYEVLGVESSKRTAEIANKRGIRTLNEFFNEKLMDKINRKFDIFNASGVFFHLEELHSVCEGIKKGLKENGVFIVQFLYMKSIMDNLAFDQIYHEHLLYYTLHSIEYLLAIHGLSMFDGYLSSIHGGSIIGFISHKGKKNKTKRLLELIKIEENSKCNEIEYYLRFRRNIEIMKKNNIDYIDSKLSESKTIYGFGAPVKGNTLLNYFEVGVDRIKYLVEKNELRRGLYSPGKHIPILIEDEVEKLPDVYYVLAWNFKKEILKNNKDLIDKGVEFYFPVNPPE